MRSPQTHHLAYTMIELLVIVLLISILAAIVVPEFKVRQTTAKVAAARMEMAAVAMAMRSYMADHGVYPPNGFQTERILHTEALQGRPESNSFYVSTKSSPSPTGGPSPFSSAAAQIYQHLTTPIAYLRVPPVDTYLVSGRVPIAAVNLSSRPPETLIRIYGFRPPFAIVHAGPSRSLSGINLARGIMTLYDPTNGTDSSGILLMMGPHVQHQTPGLTPSHPHAPPSSTSQPSRSRSLPSS